MLDDENANLVLFIWADATDIYFEGVMTDKILKDNSGEETVTVKKDEMTQSYSIRNDYDDAYKQAVEAGENPSAPTPEWQTGVDFEYTAPYEENPEISLEMTANCGIF